jgi:hypothetical protein
MHDGYDRAMLFTFVVTSGTKSFTTQHHADNLEAARDALLDSSGFREFVEAAMPTVGAVPLGEPDVHLFMPMDPLTNCWALQGGRQGEYFTSIVVATHE